MTCENKVFFKAYWFRVTQFSAVNQEFTQGFNFRILDSSTRAKKSPSCKL